jgi:hypothetical protein
MLYEVSKQNKRKGFSFLSPKDGIAMFRENRKYVKKLDKLNFNTKVDNHDERSGIKPVLNVAK